MIADTVKNVLRDDIVPLPTTAPIAPAIWIMALAGAIVTLFSDMTMHPIDCTCTKPLQRAFRPRTWVAHECCGKKNSVKNFMVSRVVLLRFLAYANCDALGGALSGQQVQKKVLNILLFMRALVSFVASSIVTVSGEFLNHLLQLGYYDGCGCCIDHFEDCQGSIKAMKECSCEIFRIHPWILASTTSSNHCILSNTRPWLFDTEGQAILTRKHQHHKLLDDSTGHDNDRIDGRRVQRWM